MNKAAKRIRKIKFKDRPNQWHHFATNKSKKYTPDLKEIADKYGLDLDGDWNKRLMPHRGRHPNAYHEFVLKKMKEAMFEAGDDVDTFLDMFNNNVIERVLNDPDMLRKKWWDFSGSF